MKILAVILSLATLILSSYPCCQETGACTEILTVVDQCENDHSQEVPPHKDTPCSPFYSCGRCPGFTVSYEILDLVSLEFEQETLLIPYIGLLPKEVYFFSLKPPRTFEV